MAAITDAFEVQVATYGSGWQAISVGVANGIRPASLAEKNAVFCLTHEATKPEEFDHDIDELIQQLLALKSKGRRKLGFINKNSN